MITQNLIKVALIILFYKHIEKKIKIMIDRLYQQHANTTEVNKNSEILENIENYYAEMLKSINSMHSAGAVLFVFCFSINIYTSYYQNEIMKYFSYMVRDSALFFISLAQLLFFYCSNKIELEQSLKRNKVNDTFKKTQLGEAVHSGKIYKNKFFRSFLFDEEIPEEIDVPIIALVDEIPFARIQDIADYLNISK